MDKVRMIKDMELKFSDIKEPRLLCLIYAKGGGTKLFQSYLDGHPEIYNIPAYPLMYLYPHWQTWQEQYQEVWDWDTIINIFCIKHASVIDSRKILGLNGLDGLGETQDESIGIDDMDFRKYLKGLLREEPVSRRSFVLAVNYAYALCKGEDITGKKVLLWHHHMMSYLDEFVKDFPNAVIFGLIRDPRIKMYKLNTQEIKTDLIKLNVTDAMIYRSNVPYQNNKLMFISVNNLVKIDAPGRFLYLRHEDLALDLPKVMYKTSDLLGIKFLDSMLESTFDGKVWWGHEVHEMPKGSQDKAGKERAKQVSQEAIKRVLSTAWQKKKPSWEIFVFEGLDYDFLLKYGYAPIYYKKDSWVERAMMVIAVWFPYQMEIEDTIFYLSPLTHAKFIATAWREATGQIKRKYYGFNAAYLYKANYRDFCLWDRPFIVRWLDQAEKSKNKSAINHSLFELAAVVYVLYIYARFLVAVLSLPFHYLYRVGMYSYTFIRRIFHGSFLPPQF